MRKTALIIAAAGLTAASLAVAPDANARPLGWGGGWGHQVAWGGGWGHRGWGGWGHRRSWGWGGGAVAAGLAAGASGGLIASSAYPAYAYDYPYYPGSRYGYYGGYAPAYGYGYPAAVETVRYVETAPVVVRRRVVYAPPAYRVVYVRPASRVVYARPAYRRVVVRRSYRAAPAVARYRPRAHLYRSATYHQKIRYHGRSGHHRAAVRTRSY